MATVAGDIVTVHIDGETADGATITRSNAVQINGLNIYQDRIIVRHEDATAITLANLNTGNDGDADLITLFTDGAAPVFQSGKELIVWTGKTFTPGATLSVNGNIDIQTTATLNCVSFAVNVSGDFINSGTYSVSASQVTTFNGTGNQSFNPGSAAISADINVTNTGGVVSLSGNALNIGANQFTI